jgi:hypothetical protein
MNLSDDQKADLLRFIDSAMFKHCCDVVAAKAASRTTFTGPAPDTGLLLALEKGVNDFPILLRELTIPSNNEPPEGPPMPKALRPVTSTLRKS